MNRRPIRPRVALYARASTKEGRQHVENQLAELRRFVDVNGWQLAATYSEYITGGPPKQGQADQLTPELRRLFEAAARREFDIVAVFALDRLTRRGIAETFSLIRRLQDMGVQFVSQTEEHFRTTGPAGELLIAVAAWIAKQERQRMSERIHAGLDRARSQGKTLGRPTGKRDARDLYRRRAAGASWRQIADQTGIPKATVQRTVERYAEVSTPTLNSNPPTRYL